MNTHRTMSYANALRMVLGDNVKITRLHWQTEEWLKLYDRTLGSRTWIGCISGHEIGIPNHLLLWGGWGRDVDSDDGVILFCARQGKPTSICSVSIGWKPTIDDTLATDWFVFTP